MVKTEQKTTAEEPIQESKNTYEIGYLVRARLSPEDADSYVREISSMIQKSSWGIVTRETPPQKIRLAYPIQKEGQAYFGVMNFELARKDLEELTRKLRLEPNLLRYLIIALDLKKLSALPTRKMLRRRPPALKETRAKESTKEKEIKMRELEKKLEEIIEG